MLIMKAPTAKKIKKEFYEHGNIRIDNYFWLNQRNNPDVAEYLTSENRYTEKSLEHVKLLREKLYNEMVSRIKKEDETVPYPDNGYFYNIRYFKGKEYPVYCRKKGSLESAEEIILDVNELAEGREYCHVAKLFVSPDNNILAFGVDYTGRRNYTIYFKDLNSGKLFPDKIKNSTGAAIWVNDNRTVFYSSKDETLRPYKIFKHTLFSDSVHDKEVFHERDKTYTAHVLKTKSGKFIIIGSYSNVSTEFRFLSADNPDGNFRIIEPRKKRHEYYVEHSNDKFYILTNSCEFVKRPLRDSNSRHIGS